MAALGPTRGASAAFITAIFRPGRKSRCSELRNLDPAPGSPRCCKASFVPKPRPRRGTPNRRRVMLLQSMSAPMPHLDPTFGRSIVVLTMKQHTPAALSAHRRRARQTPPGLLSTRSYVCQWRRHAFAAAVWRAVAADCRVSSGATFGQVLAGRRSRARGAWSAPLVRLEARWHSRIRVVPTAID